MVPRLHFVTDDDVVARPDFVDTAVAVLERCAPDVAVHLRAHRTPARRVYDVAERLVARAPSGTTVIVNDRIDIALAFGTRGVQLGRRSIPVSDARALLGAGTWIGYSAHAPQEAADAVAGGADFVLMGTIYESASHEGRAPAGVDAVRECRARAAAPVIAIGGVTPDRVAELADAGASGVAVLGGVWKATDAPAAAAAYAAAVHVAWESSSEGR